MAASIAASAFFPTTSSSPSSLSKKNAIGEGPDSVDLRGIASRPNSSSRAMQVKAQAQSVPKINGTKVEEEAPSSGPRTFYNQLPDWSMLLAAITTIFLAAEKQWTLLDWKPKRPDMLADAFGFGKIVQDGLVFRQNFSIRSYEIGADQTASIETLMNHLQETALNHVRSAGLLGDGFGATPEMTKRNLIWVVSKIQVIVDHYPSWGDIVEVDTWVDASGKNGMRRDWHVRDFNTGQTILKATSVWVMMDKLTRKLKRIPEEVLAEIGPYFLGRNAIVDEDSKKLPKVRPKAEVEGGADKTAPSYVRKGLTPRWGDLDVNQHVNNVKYIGWILESAPISMLEKHELASITLDYKRECRRDSTLESITTVHSDSADGESAETSIQCEHLLQLDSGPAIVKARTMWRPKKAHIEEDIGITSAEGA
ncbi:palmitoyl-acyl carrier protein thioesterase, chloroplastic-like isoform X2 [Ananas comosus]|nr:palmitoyl-acyl carrier protein thioesterase, chloroplastic-like isoform X2 [Ananas comosus]XP_020088739.1 palmitoyl-acyl carrier protein thioesterase, chloroplastic-like isoform X2 [Ananas comosus]OAY82927.1 Palmitoyl-acyl carrier protein thioesterase, chloroplastic [Ananas comosus]